MSLCSTIKNKIKISGITPFSGQSSTVTFLPAKRDNGIRFIRTDKNNSVIVANCKNIDYNDCFKYTSITNGEHKIKFPEHILCYLWCHDWYVWLMFMRKFNFLSYTFFPETLTTS